MKGADLARQLPARRSAIRASIHIQGGMVTDADLDERSAIVRARTDHLGDDTIKDGVPAVGGAVGDRRANGAVSLREGVIYADGVRGVLAAIGRRRPRPTPLALFTQQADLPLGPALPGRRCGRSMPTSGNGRSSPLEDPYLADAGLHGAETAFPHAHHDAAQGGAARRRARHRGRHRRLPADRHRRARGDAAQRRKTIVDECDPCAERRRASSRWSPMRCGGWKSSAIEGTPDRAGRRSPLPGRWRMPPRSLPADVSHEDFERASKVYEFFSPITESSCRRFRQLPTDARRSAFVDDLATAPNPPTDHDGDDWPFVRRWDGFAAIDPRPARDREPARRWLCHRRRRAARSRCRRRLQATLDIARPGRGRRRLLAGRAAPLRRRGRAHPPGQRHAGRHRAPLLRRCCRTNAARRRVAAHRRASAASCPSRRSPICPPTMSASSTIAPKLYDDAENVQEALDNLCADLGRRHRLRPRYLPCSLRRRHQRPGSAGQSLQDRLLVRRRAAPAHATGAWSAASCRSWRSRGPASSRSRPAPFSTAPASYPSSRAAEIDLDKLSRRRTSSTRTKATSPDAFKGEVCLALAADRGRQSRRLRSSTRPIAFGPADPGFFSNGVAACVEANKPLGVRRPLHRAHGKRPEDRARMM